MAIVLGQKNVQDLTRYENNAIGITLPIQITNTAFNQSFKTLDAIKSNIKNLLLTNKRERLVQTEFGCGMNALLFNFNNEILASDIKNEIESAIAIWLPYVTIHNIDVTQTNYNKDTNSIGVSITFTIPGIQNMETVTFNIGG